MLTCEMIDVRDDFPTLKQPHHEGVPLVYLDNGATSQKPAAVIQAVNDFYTSSNANVHRGLHKLSEVASAAYEGARRRVAQFIGAASWREVVFTRGTTESINLVAQTWGRATLKPGDVVLTTMMEHHANIVPWQLLAAERGFEIVYAPLRPDGQLDLDFIAAALCDMPVRLLTVTHVSNVLGTVNPITELARLAHLVDARILVDGAQAVSHLPVNVAALDVDFYAFSGHKMYGPTGIGVLYGRRALLEAMPPYMGGGDMIETVSITGSTFAAPPLRFEAGTPPIAQAIGLGAAIDYIETVGRHAIHTQIADLTAYALDRLSAIPGLTIYGAAPVRSGLVTFTLDGLHAHDVAQLLDMQGIAVRAGHHCAMPLHTTLGVPATVRVSFGMYNTCAEIDVLADALEEIRHV